MVLFVLLGAYAFFLQSKLTLEVGLTFMQQTVAGLYMATSCSRALMIEQESGTRGFVRSRGFKGESSDSLISEVPVTLLLPINLGHVPAGDGMTTATRLALPALRKDGVSLAGAHICQPLCGAL